MGGYLNPGNEKFGEALNSQIYVDKTGLIEYTNRVMYSNQKYVCQPASTLWQVDGGQYVGGLLQPGV